MKAVARLMLMLLPPALLSMPAQAQDADLTPPPRDAVLAVMTQEASAEVARRTGPEAHRQPRRAPVADGASAPFLVAAMELSLAADVPAVGDYVARAAAKGPLPDEVDERLYERDGRPGRLKPLEQRLGDALPDLVWRPAPKRLTWPGCGALFLAPAAYARLSVLTGDAKYLQAMDAAWWESYDRLWDADAHLYACGRRTRAVTTALPGGEGSVMAGLARVLEIMPADFPSRPRYMALYHDMAARVIARQGADGVWRQYPRDLADAEVLDTALETYALAFGINHGLLDRRTYLPRVLEAWAALGGHVPHDAAGPFILTGLQIMTLGDPATPLPVPVIVHDPLKTASPEAERPAGTVERPGTASEARARTSASDPITDDPSYRSPKTIISRPASPR